jgi:putative ABC transport system permease protein
MFYYYLGLALRSLRRNVVLTVLMIAAIGVGIGASMTTLTVFRAMDADPIPDKSRRLFAVQIDNWGPKKSSLGGGVENLQPQLSYTDAMALYKGHQGARQTMMYVTGFAVIPANPELKPFQAVTRATFTDFFPMFEAPFLFGGPWSRTDDDNHSEVVVIARELNDKVFGGANSVGKSINLNNRPFRVVGVLDTWDPTPKYFDLNNNAYGKGEQIFVPLNRAIDDEMSSWGNNNCAGDVGTPGWEGHLHSECVWFQYWVELNSAGDLSRFNGYLKNYLADQRNSGRFNWAPTSQVRDVREWLVYQKAVTKEARILVLVSFSFLLVCLLNAMGLMLAKIMGRASDIGVRRALGAKRKAIFSQCIIEAAVVGLVGGLLGLVLTSVGLWGLRSLLSNGLNRLTHFSISDIAIAISVAVVATILAGLYPTWRAAQVQPAWQLKTQ